MTPEKIIQVNNVYMLALLKAGVAPQRMDLSRTFESLSQTERLAHAAHLCTNIPMHVEEGKYDKALRHLAATQLCLSYAGWYTLQELIDHNRS